MLRYLIEKEFKQLKRNSFLPRLILLFPCMMMLVMPWAATLEIENLRIAVIDNDRSPSSERLVHLIEASRYFQLTALPPSVENNGKLRYGVLAFRSFPLFSTDGTSSVLRTRPASHRERPGRHAAGNSTRL